MACELSASGEVKIYVTVAKASLNKAIVRIDRHETWWYTPEQIEAS